MYFQIFIKVNISEFLESKYSIDHCIYFSLLLKCFTHDRHIFWHYSYYRCSNKFQNANLHHYYVVIKENQGKPKEACHSCRVNILFERTYYMYELNNYILFTYFYIEYNNI